ncbi:MAG TPA: DUF3618 domain-containing protein [Candidatus Tectomicrobia bacterium]|nr:DUF3618 domain-containing protein [Candidatus Tectomicrobia bacterium]
MARSPAEIQADIALTRRGIEHQLDALQRRVPHAWWTPWAMTAGGLAVGILLSQIPFLRLIGLGARTVQTGITVAGTVAAVDRFLAERRRLRAA